MTGTEQIKNKKKAFAIPSMLNIRAPFGYESSSTPLIKNSDIESIIPAEQTTYIKE